MVKESFVLLLAAIITKADRIIVYPGFGVHDGGYLSTSGHSIYDFVTKCQTTSPRYIESRCTQRFPLICSAGPDYWSLGYTIPSEYGFPVSLPLVNDVGGDTMAGSWSSFLSSGWDWGTDLQPTYNADFAWWGCGTSGNVDPNHADKYLCATASGAFYTSNSVLTAFAAGYSGALYTLNCASNAAYLCACLDQPTFAPSHTPTRTPTAPSRAPSHRPSKFPTTSSPTSSSPTTTFPTVSPTTTLQELVQGGLVLQLVPVYWVGFAILVGCLYGNFSKDNASLQMFGERPSTGAVIIAITLLPLTVVGGVIYYTITYFRTARANQREYEQNVMSKLQNPSHEIVPLANPVMEDPGHARGLNVEWLDISGNLDSSAYEGNTKRVLPLPENEGMPCAISWRWEWESPHDLDTGCRRILKMAQDTGYRYCWMDRACVPQQSFSMDKVLDASTVYDMCPVIVASLSPEFDPKFSYCDRLWTSVELYRALIVNQRINCLEDISPSVISIRKFRQIFRHIIDILKMGDLPLATVKFCTAVGGGIIRSEEFSMRDIDLILGKRFDSILALGECLDFVHQRDHPMYKLARIDFKLFRTQYRLGLARSIEMRKCSDEKDRPVAAVLLLGTPHLVELANTVLKRTQQSKLPIYLVTLENGATLKPEEVMEFKRDVVASVPITLVGVTKHTQQPVAVVRCLDVEFDLNGKGQLTLHGSGTFFAAVRAQASLKNLDDQPVITETYRGYKVTMGDSTIFVHVRTTDPICVPEHAVHRFEGMEVDVITSKLIKPNIPGYVPGSPSEPFFARDRIRFIMHVAHDTRFDVGLAMPCRLSAIEATALRTGLCVGSRAPFKMVGVWSGPVTQATLKQFMKSLESNPDADRCIFVGESLLRTTKSDLTINDLEALCKNINIDVAFARRELIGMKCAMAGQFDLPWTLVGSDAHDLCAIGTKIVGAVESDSNSSMVEMVVDVNSMMGETRSSTYRQAMVVAVEVLPMFKITHGIAEDRGVATLFRIDHFMRLSELDLKDVPLADILDGAYKVSKTKVGSTLHFEGTQGWTRVVRIVG